MPNKKQYIITLGAAVLIFFTLFIISYSYAYQKNLKNPIVVPDEMEIEAASQVEEVAETIEDVIGIDTHIVVKLIDKNKGRISESEIDPLSLLGLNKEEIEKRFKEYRLQKFSTEEVVLNKLIETAPKEVAYKLGIKDSVIGVIEEETEQFTSLGLPVKTFSKGMMMLIINQTIEINATEKEKLEQNPYYIEQILQSYAE